MEHSEKTIGPLLAEKPEVSANAEFLAQAAHFFRRSEISISREKEPRICRKALATLHL
jgi:hypothetical protein